MHRLAQMWACSASVNVSRRGFLGWIGQKALWTVGVLGGVLAVRSVKAHAVAAAVNCGGGRTCPDGYGCCPGNHCCPNGYPHFCSNNRRCYRTFTEAQENCGNSYAICGGPR